MTGLTASQVAERRQRGDGNAVKLNSSRSYGDIIRTNLFSAVNIVLYVIGLGMLLVGDFRSAFAVVGLLVFNAAVGIVQEIRSKRKLDQIALLAQAKITVLRDGQEEQVNPGDLVLGDVILVRAGDQLPVDGVIADDGRIEVDESALTGESDMIAKSTGDKVLSGSLCITGAAAVEATGVGEKSFANQLTKNARTFKLELTPLQRQVNRLLRALLLIVLFFAFLYVLSLFVLDVAFSDWLSIMAVITGSVSVGLLTLITLNYSWGAVRIGQKGALVQQINAVESLSNVTVLCTDKTGTLTTNNLRYQDLVPVGIDKTQVEALLGDFAASGSAPNKTSLALSAGLPHTVRKVVDEVPFASVRKWSALAFDAPAEGDLPARKGVYVLGALEMLESRMPVDDAARQQLQAWSEQGIRVLVFGGNSAVMTLHDAAGEPVLPPLTLLAVVSLTDELRPHLQETIAAFTENGVRLKVISGDNPQTVAALARQAGIPGELKAVSGPELAAMSESEFAHTAAEATVFGRVTPQQKEQLVTALRSQGEYVAMTGDGVNDVLSLKKANLGIAMESGSTATRSVAAIILMKDSFEAMPPALKEGQRIIGSIHNILKLYMVTVFALLLLIVGTSTLQVAFPFTNLQNTMLSFFVRGAPPFLLAFTAIAVARRSSLSFDLLHFTVPAAVLLFVFGLLIFIFSLYLARQRVVEVAITPDMLTTMARIEGVDPATMTEDKFRIAAATLSAQTALVTFFVMTGLLAMLFADPPLPWFAGASEFHRRNWLLVAAALGLAIAYIVILFVPFLRGFFQLVPLSWPFIVGLAVLTVLWALLLRWFWRSKWLLRFLDMEAIATPTAAAPVPPAPEPKELAPHRAGS